MDISEVPKISKDAVKEQKFLSIVHAVEGIREVAISLAHLSAKISGTEAEKIPELNDITCISSLLEVIPGNINNLKEFMSGEISKIRSSLF